MSGYLERIADAVQIGTLPRAALTAIDVEHGFGCNAPRGPCTCHPRITASVGDEVLVIGTGGAILERRPKS